MVELFKTTRTRIRRLSKNDLDALRVMLTDAEVMKHTGFNKPQSEEQILERLDGWMADPESPFGVWGAEEKSSGDLVAWFMLKIIDDEDPELGFMIPKENWGKGYATEIARAFLDYALQTLNHGRVIAVVHPENSASIRVLEKIGMKPFTPKNPAGRDDSIYFESRG